MDHVTPQGTSSDLVSAWLRKSLLDDHNDILDAPLPAELLELVASLSHLRRSR